MQADVAPLASAALLGTAVTALYSRRVSVSLIMLFYSSLVLGLIFTVYGSILIGLLEIVTFAGAVSVMLLTAVLMTGESDLRMGAGAARASLVGAAVVAAIAASSLVFGQVPGGGATAEGLSPTSIIQFIWLYRPWDLLILLMVFASSMVVVVNLFSKEGE
jgi:NADH:ubiquinone oxidoreductase subunit 6 (subunit J)